MRQYKQLTEDEHIEIYAMKQAGFNQSQMVQQLEGHRCTLCRELARNAGGRGYHPKQAQRWATERRCRRDVRVQRTLLVPWIRSPVSSL